MTAIARALEPFRRRVVAAATDPFGHAPFPLANSFDHMGDPGLFGPDSVSWRITGDVSTFIGGVRALLIQAAHPEVVAGVFDHSRYRDDPLGRLSRTSSYVTASTFGALPEVEQAVETVKRAHSRIAGVSHRGVPYSADTPEFAAWVHNALTESFLTTHRFYGPRPLSEADADRYVSEQTQLGQMLYADPLPTTARDLSHWIVDHPDIQPSPGMAEAVPFLASPPLRPALKAGYRLLYTAAVATIPETMRDLLGIRAIPGAVRLGVSITSYLRWALGASPSWHLALVRSGAPVPDGLFKQPLPIPLPD